MYDRRPHPIAGMRHRCAARAGTATTTCGELVVLFDDQGGARRSGFSFPWLSARSSCLWTQDQAMRDSWPTLQRQVAAHAGQDPVRSRVLIDDHVEELRSHLSIYEAAMASASGVGLGIVRREGTQPCRRARHNGPMRPLPRYL